MAPGIMAEDSSFESLYALYEKHVSRIVYAILRYKCADPPEHARDVEQDIWVKLRQRSAQYDSVLGEFEPWLNAVARNASIDHIKQCYRRASPVKGGEVEGILGEAPFEGAESRIVNRILLGELWAKLNDGEQTLATLLFIEGISVREVAQRFGIEEGTVRARKFKLTRKVQKLAGRA